MNRLLCTLISLAALVAASGAQAEKPRFGDTLTVSVGGMNHRGKATLAVTRPDAPVDELTFRSLGLDDKTDVFWGDLSWQFAERWNFRVNYSSFDTSGQRIAATGGNFKGIDWGVGARLSTDFELELYIADLTWDLLKSENGHLGFGVGLHAADIDVGLLVEVGASIDGDSGFVTLGDEASSLLAPLPNLSLSGGFMIGDRVYLNGSLAYMSLSYDKYDGRLFSARGAVEWRPWEHVGLGLAYQYVDMDLEIDEEDKAQLYDFEFYGPVLFLSVGF